MRTRLGEIPESICFGYEMSGNQFNFNLSNGMWERARKCQRAAIFLNFPLTSPEWNKYLTNITHSLKTEHHSPPCHWPLCPYIVLISSVKICFSLHSQTLDPWMPEKKTSSQTATSESPITTTNSYNLWILMQRERFVRTMQVLMQAAVMTFSCVQQNKTASGEPPPAICTDPFTQRAFRTKLTVL